MNALFLLHHLCGFCAHGGFSYDHTQVPFVYAQGTPFFKADAGGGHEGNQAPLSVFLYNDGTVVNQNVSVLRIEGKNVVFVKNIFLKSGTAGEAVAIDEEEIKRKAIEEYLAMQQAKQDAPNNEDAE